MANNDNTERQTFPPRSTESDVTLSRAGESPSSSTALTAQDRAEEGREWTIGRIESVIGSIA